MIAPFTFPAVRIKVIDRTGVDDANAEDAAEVYAGMLDGPLGVNQMGITYLIP